MTNNELKQAVADKLADLTGEWVNRHLSMHDLCKKVEAATGQRKGYRQNQYDFLFAFTGAKREYGPAKWIPPFRPISTLRHPRADEIDRLPVPISMAGIGNGGDSGMGRGR
ncbi:hypothetical protein PT7_P066 (plasmid) [Pusillimonas sp. T7-7]|uniref:hypothetical protein n=1 Tax=Pusillimonas sp. (strain T7-7) TaxID=1007105 RepID=UPI0002084BCF|nr:hypothetical protein [Pusillimonas sp. T7-7]AEC22302.1 hypothetical protein PT7_P066 [Pusillimonas sp. T7-7]